jgi:hypothetical protein
MKACLSSKNSATNGKRTKRTDEYPTRREEGRSKDKTEATNVSRLRTESHDVFLRNSLFDILQFSQQKVMPFGWRLRRATDAVAFCQMCGREVGSNHVCCRAFRFEGATIESTSIATTGQFLQFEPRDARHLAVQETCIDFLPAPREHAVDA